MKTDDSVMCDLVAHDEKINRLGRSIWVGAEPTYTDRFSEEPEWLYEALGDDKLDRAKRMLSRLAVGQRGAAVLRCVGRQYGDEARPRWSLGLYARRDGTRVWPGPLDPSVVDLSMIETNTMPEPERMAAALAKVLQSMEMNARTVGAPLADRVVFRADGKDPPVSVDDDPLLGRPSLHGQHVEGAEVVDALADAGNFMVVCDVEEGVMSLELPRIPDVNLFQRLLSAISSAALKMEAPTMMLVGHPPPVDQTVSWMTVTPDPAVIEVNMAPTARAADLLDQLRQLDQAAADEGLATYRLQYNGVECDSGGGGHITLGGKRPSASPFLKVPSLLPSLVRYFNRHPSLSYLHATDSLGPSSQAPRVDESLYRGLPELSLALELLSRVDDPSPETLWVSLAPFLADPSGNSHRTEINIEKLWNPYLGGRGCNGLVEFRALRMASTPETTASIAALLRAVVAMLAEHPSDQPLIDWGSALHQRFSLPFYLHRDLKEVLLDLESRGLGLGASLVENLLRDRDLVLTKIDLGGTRLEIRRAMEFWPLVGDVATQELGGSRLIDSSTSRIEIRLCSLGRDDDLDDWRLTVGDWLIPLSVAQDETGDVRLTGMRYRTFVPFRGLHPTLPAQSPMTFMLAHPTNGNWRVCLHEWHPESEPYPGLPATIDEARSRRRQRCVIESLANPPDGPTVQPPSEAIGDHIVDLRWR